MESKKRDFDQKALKRSSYINRKECIKKKTMELATLCGIDACTVMLGADGEIESWPENPREAKAIINKFKELTSNNPYRRTTVKDESHKKAVDVPGGEVVSCQENATHVKGSFENFRYLTDIPCQRTTIRDESSKKVFAEPDGDAEIVRLARMAGKSSYQECLKQVDSKLEALVKRIEFLRTDQEHDMTCCCMENKQLDYAEKTSPERRKVNQEPVFLFDLNVPPPDEPECSSLSFEDCSVRPNRQG